MANLSARQWAGFLAGMALTSASLSTGFIWACGSKCIDEPLVWTSGRRTLLVFGAALAAWWGYLIAHYMVAGTLIDDSTHGENEVSDSSETAVSPNLSPLFHHLGVLAGVGILVLGMVIGVIYIRQGDHLMTNIGGILFLGGYVIAHHVETGLPV